MRSSVHFHDHSHVSQSLFCRGKIDDPNLTVVIVEEVAVGTGGEKFMYRVACLAGVLDRLYHPSYLQPVPGVSALAMGLQTVCPHANETLARRLVHAQTQVCCAAGGGELARPTSRYQRSPSDKISKRCGRAGAGI